jgi:uncharacterized protein YdgA (DUF945 family)
VLKGIETTMLQRNQGATILVGYAFKVKEGVATGAGMDQQGFSDAVLELELDRLDKKALSKYFEDLTNAEQTGVSQQARTQLAAQLWLGLMNELLKGSPEVRVKQLGVKTANGTLSGTAVLGFDGKDFTEITSPAELMTRTKFSGAAEASAVLLRAWLAKDARAHAVKVLSEQGSYGDEAKVTQLAEQLIQQQLAALETAGVLKLEGEKFVLNAELAGGKLLLNGNPADQLLGPMLVPPAPAPVPAAAAQERKT